MGSYNTVHVPCPKCQKRNKLQTKSGSCKYADVTLKTASLGDLWGVVNEVHTCTSCGAKYQINAVHVATTVLHVEVPEDDDDE